MVVLHLLNKFFLPSANKDYSMKLRTRYKRALVLSGTAIGLAYAFIREFFNNTIKNHHILI